MNEIQAAWLEFIMVGGLGVIFVLEGIISNIILKRNNRSCTAQTLGAVTKYGFPGEGQIYPVVEYSVNGTCYETRKKFAELR